MPTPDTAMLARADALRFKGRLPERFQKAAKVLQQMDEGAGETLRAYTRPSELLRETASSLKSLATQPKAVAKALVQSVKDPESRNQMIGSMMVPDPLNLVKALRAGRLPDPVKADIVVPETLALPEEALEVALAKRGAPDHETGWFKGEDGILRKELEPATFDLSDLPKQGEWFPEDFWSHPDLKRRFEEKGLFGEGPGFLMDQDKLSPKFGASYMGPDNEVWLGEAFRTMPEKLQKEMLTHELQHAVQQAGFLKDPMRGSSPGKGVSFRKYLLNPGEREARASAARDYLLDPRYRELVPHDWNTKKMRERLKWGGYTPKMEGPQEFLQDMEQWLQLAEPNK